MTAVVAVLGIFAIACSSSDSAATTTGGPIDGTQDNERIKLVTTLYPLEYFATRIGGDLVEVTNLIAPGVEAHDFEPSPNDVRLMRGTDIIVFNGLGFEPWMTRALESLNNDSPIVVEAARGLAGDSSGQTVEHVDPHVWLDLDSAGKQAERIRDAMMQAAPQYRDAIQANAQELLDELKQLDAEYRQGIQDCKINTFVTSHSAFGHMADRYGLVQMPISGLSPESEPSPRALADLIAQLKNAGVKYILAEPAASKRLSQTVATELGATILPLQPLESLTPEQATSGADFMSVMRDNLRSLEIALECTP